MNILKKNTLTYLAMMLCSIPLYAMQETTAELITEAEHLTKEFKEEVEDNNQAMLLLCKQLKQKKAHAKRPKRPSIKDKQPCSCCCLNCVIS